jgi:hypothetical protein
MVSRNPDSTCPPCRLNSGGAAANCDAIRLSIQARRSWSQPCIQTISSRKVLAMNQFGQTYCPRIGQRSKFRAAGSSSSVA